MATLTTTDQNFREQNYNGSGIRNAQVVRGEESRNNRTSADNRRMSARQNTSFDFNTPSTSQPQKLRRSYYNPETADARSLQNTNQAERSIGLLQKKFAQVKVVGTGGIIAAWATPLYLFFILPTALLATLAFAVGIGLFLFSGGVVDANVVTSVISSASQSLTGLIAAGFFVIWIAASGVVLCMNLVSIIIASWQLWSTGSKPVTGSGMVWKVLGILVALFGSVCPLAQIAPLPILWLIPVFFHPK